VSDKSKLPEPGTKVVLRAIPPGLLTDLPASDQSAITQVVGESVLLVEYDELGRAELEFVDSRGTIHYIYVKPEFISSVSEDD
jgi:hypothetical protein